jgi:hypothetical protein
LAADITQNGAESGADLLELEIRERFSEAAGGSAGEFRFIVRDNGRGMDRSELDRAKDPFVSDGVKHPGRRVGLGIPFLIQTASLSGGGWNISSVKAEGGVPEGGGGRTPAGRRAESEGSPPGTLVEAWFDLNNVDTPPVGDIPGLLRTVLLFTGPREIIIRRSRTGGEGDLDYEVRKTELADALGDIEDVSSLVLLGKYLKSLEEGT